MLWQNASARTVASASPAASRRHSRSSSVRIVVAPARRRQNAAKSWWPSSRSEASFIRSRSSGCDHGSTWERTSGSTSSRVVRDPVGVAAPERGEAGVEAGRGGGHPAYPDVGVEEPVQPAPQRLVRRLRRAPGRGVVALAGHVEVHHLAARVHAGVGAPGADHPHLGQPQRRRQGGLELGLDRAQPGLRRPSAEVGAVVGQVDPDAHPQIIPSGRRGTGRGPGSRQSAASRLPLRARARPSVTDRRGGISPARGGTAGPRRDARP